MILLTPSFKEISNHCTKGLIKLLFLAQSLIKSLDEIVLDRLEPWWKSDRI
jgi:hypothetical protein